MRQVGLKKLQAYLVIALRFAHLVLLLVVFTLEQILFSLFIKRYKGDDFIESLQTSVADKQERGKPPRMMRFIHYKNWAFHLLVSITSKYYWNTASNFFYVKLMIEKPCISSFTEYQQKVLSLNILQTFPPEKRNLSGRC